MKNEVKTNLFTGTWEVASSYEIVNGVIAPSKGATFSTFQPEKKSDVLLLEFIKLVEETFNSKNIYWNPDAKSKFGTKWTIPNEVLEKILTWCNSYGLLGLLPQEFETLYPFPFWMKEQIPKEKTSPDVGLSEKESWIAFQPILSQLSGVYLSLFINENFQNIKKGEFLEGEPVSEKYLTSKFRKPQLIIRNLENGLLETKNPQELFKYFPRLKPNNNNIMDIPLPTTSWYSEEYGESLNDLMNVFYMFFRVFRAFKSYPEKQVWKDKELTNYKMKLEILARKVNPTILVGKNKKLYTKLVFPSLVSYLAHSLIFSLTSNRPIKFCENCGKMFLPKNTSQKYHSTRCKFTAQKRKQRINQKIKKEAKK